MFFKGFVGFKTYILVNQSYRMDKKYAIVALLITLLAVVLVSGCTGNGDDEDENGGNGDGNGDGNGGTGACPSSCDDKNACTEDVCTAATNYECRNNQITPCCGNDICETGETISSCVVDCSTGCINSDQCDDGDECTTDSCVNGACNYVVEADCEIVVQDEAYISKVHFTDPEWIEVSGNNWGIEDWTIVNNQGEVYIKFGKKTRVNGFIRIYSEPGISTNTERYVNKPEFWSDAGDKAILKDDDGNVKSQMIG
jgi:hypothetical protein